MTRFRERNQKWRSSTSKSWRAKSGSTASVEPEGVAGVVMLSLSLKTLNRSEHAVLVGVASVLLGLGVALSISPALFAAACGYVLLNAAYTGFLRRIAIADICAIAGAFVVRALAGSIAASVPSSRWFIVVVSFAALFVAAGKRYADFLDRRARADPVRRPLHAAPRPGLAGDARAGGLRTMAAQPARRASPRRAAGAATAPAPADRAARLEHHGGARRAGI